MCEPITRTIVTESEICMQLWFPSCCRDQIYMIYEIFVFHIYNETNLN